MRSSPTSEQLFALTLVGPEFRTHTLQALLKERGIWMSYQALNNMLRRMSKVGLVERVDKRGGWRRKR